LIPFFRAAASAFTDDTGDFAFFWLALIADWTSFSVSDAAASVCRRTSSMT
jgi:hypothetical protein